MQEPRNLTSTPERLRTRWPESGVAAVSDDVPGIENDPTPKSAALAEELRRVAGTRSPKALRDAHLPTLQRYLAYPDDPDRKLDALRNELEASVGAIADPQFRAAAKELFGFGEHRWTPLRARGERASASFGCSFDAYRRARRSTGTSLLDETVEQLADAIRQRDRTLESVGRPATEPGPTNGHPMPAVAVPVDRHRRVAILSGVLALVAIVALLSVALTHRPDPPDERRCDRTRDESDTHGEGPYDHCEVPLSDRRHR